jgi:predicted RNase H-like HicB family nuclease
MKYAVIYEKTDTGYSAYVPDLPGCVAAGDTVEETEYLMRGAIEMHLAGMREDGEPIPEPTTKIGMLPVESVA